MAPTGGDAERRPLRSYAEFELWQGTRRVDGFRRKGAVPSADKIAEIVIEREMAIRDSQWPIAESARLLEQRPSLLKKARGRAH